MRVSNLSCIYSLGYVHHIIDDNVTSFVRGQDANIVRECLWGNSVFVVRDAEGNGSEKIMQWRQADAAGEANIGGEDMHVLAKSYTSYFARLHTICHCDK